MAQGLALYESLEKTSSEPFTLHVLAMDDQCWQTLKRLDLPHMEITLLDTVELDLALQTIKSERTWAEWCWGMASQYCLWLMKRGLPEISYIDADCLAFGDLSPVFLEIGERSIAITPHRFIPRKQYLETTSGVFNVGLIHFKNTITGRACLDYWAMRVRTRCSSLSGCGDQKYLEEFIPLFGSEVCVIENIGVNAGPWSIGNWQVTEGPCVDGQPLLLYHAHEYVHGERLTYYQLRPEDVEFIYAPYAASIEVAAGRIMGVPSGSASSVLSNVSRSYVTIP